MAITQELNGYKQRTAELTRDAFLGTLVIFSVNDCDVKHSEVSDRLKQVGLGHLTPRPPADSDKFCVAAENGQRRKFPADSNGVIERLLVRHVTRVEPTKDGPPGKIVRKVVSEFVNPSELSLRYPTLGGGEITFWYADGRVEVQPYEDATFEARKLLTDILTQYQNTRACLDGSALRSIITRVLIACNAAAWKDGVAFVPITHEDTVGALESWAAVMKEDFAIKIEVDSIPLLNDQKQAGKVLEKAKDDISADVNRLRSEVVDQLESGVVTMRKATALNGKLQLLLGKAKTYESLLQHEEIVTSTALDVLELQVQQLYRNAN